RPMACRSTADQTFPAALLNEQPIAAAVGEASGPGEISARSVPGAEPHCHDCLYLTGLRFAKAYSILERLEAGEHDRTVLQNVIDPLTTRSDGNGGNIRTLLRFPPRVWTQ